MKSISIIIPAHNEEKRIGRTLAHYLDYFDTLRSSIEPVCAEFFIVLNGCTDNTARVVQEIAVNYTNVHLKTLRQAGKGFAIQEGFRIALNHTSDLIGFVDADMATEPRYFHDLIRALDSYDSIIASRYMPGASVYPPRPWIKRAGSRLVYDSLVRALFGMHYYDVQCGAKLFKREVINTVLPYLSVQQWSFDVELLYLCKRFGFSTKEHPTVWHDQVDSKLNILRDGLRMPASLVQIRMRHARTAHLLKND